MSEILISISIFVLAFEIGLTLVLFCYILFSIGSIDINIQVEKSELTTGSMDENVTKKAIELNRTEEDDEESSSRQSTPEVENTERVDQETPLDEFTDR